MVVVHLRESGDAWDLVRGGLPEPNSAFLTSRNIAPSAAANNGGPVLIFTASADPDALATVRTLTALLKADLIRYEVHPVDGYAHLRDKFLVLISGDAAVEPRAILCVNCGAMVDLGTLLELSDEARDAIADVRVLVIDSHRPYHLRNVNNDRIVLLHDTDDFDPSVLPISFNMEDQWGNVPDERSSDEDSSDESRSDDDSDSESDLSNFIDDDESQGDQGSEAAYESDSQVPSALVQSDHQDDSEEARVPSKRRQLKNPEVEAYLKEVEKDDVRFADEGSDKDSDDESIKIRKGARKRRLQSPDSEKRKRKKRRSRGGHRKRSPNDPEALEKLALQEYYSNASTATSSACISHGIATLLRRANQDSLWMAILGTTSQYMTSSISQPLYENQMAFCREGVKSLQPNTRADGETSEVQNVGYVPSCSGSAMQRIAQSVELRLDLLRHWTLFESLSYSSYVATRLATWRQTGRRRLLELLATLGIPLRSSKQQWRYMEQKNKVALEAQLQSAISRFDLGENIQYDSFVRTLPGHRGDISAADFIHAVTSLLEVDNSRWDHHSAEAASSIDRFWRAYDALDSKHVKLLEDGLDLAIFVQKVTAEIGGDVIERRKYVPSGPFRYVFLRDEQHKEFLTQPILLRRLALFLNLALIRQGVTDKPFIILAPDVVRSVWIAVAATTSSQRNDFGQRFRKAAERNGSVLTYSGFDSSVCEIKDGQEIEFVRFLHDVL